MTARGGDEALALAEQQKPDLILLDMIMRGTDGWRFLSRRQTQTNLRGVPVIIVTGLGVASEQWAHELGADGLLRKPIDVDRMMQTIHDTVA
jgi:CheY-like chemotaxis protein